VIGQRRLFARLGEQAVRGDVAHGYELSGPRSIGKHTLALRLAQTLNCATGPAVPGGCGTCIACRKIERGLHPDVREITRLVDQAKRDDRKNITIEQVREMQRDLALRPLEGRRRVVIIDDAADLSDRGSNTLLCRRYLPVVRRAGKEIELMGRQRGPVAFSAVVQPHKRITATARHCVTQVHRHRILRWVLSHAEKSSRPLPQGDSRTICGTSPLALLQEPWLL